MRYAYDPFIMKRTADGRIFCVNPKMPFESFVNCFKFEHPFFLVAQLEDGRVAITPNTMCIPTNLIQGGFWPEFLFPQGFEYVTMKHGTYPVIISAHPLPNFEEWFRGFARCVDVFLGETLTDFIMRSFEVEPLKFEGKQLLPQKEKVTV